MDGRREVKPHFGCRDFVGATETLQNKRVVEMQCGQPGRSVPTEFACLFVETDVLGGPKTNDYRKQNTPSKNRWGVL